MKRNPCARNLFVYSLFVLALAAFIGVSTAAVSAEELTYPKVVRFASPSPGTMLYSVNSGLAKVASENTPMTVLIVPVTGTPAWYPMLTKAGTADIATDNMTVYWQMWNGKPAPEPIPKGFPAEAPYEQSKEIRILIGGLKTQCGFLARKDSGLVKVDDLRGKKVGWGWSGFPPNVSITLANLLNGGLTIDDVQKVNLAEVVAGVKAVQEGRVDASTCAVGMGAVNEADTLVGVRFLENSFDAARIKAGQQAMPGCATMVVKAPQAGIAKDTPVWGMDNGLLVTSKMPDHVAYKLVEAWYNHYKDYAPIHKLLEAWTPDTFVDKSTTVPYHNGAVKFFKEKGIWTPEMEELQNKLLKS